MIIVIVHIQVKAESLAAFEGATADDASNSRLEPGVVRFDVLRQQDDSTRFVLVEVYQDEHAVTAHSNHGDYLRWRDRWPTSWRRHVSVSPTRTYRPATADGEPTAAGHRLT